MRPPFQYWIDRANEIESEAKSARVEADKRPSISVADLVTYNKRLISHMDNLYEVTFIAFLAILCVIGIGVKVSDLETRLNALSEYATRIDLGCVKR